MRILITGGAGFIGSNLAAMALAKGIEVTILDDLSTGFRENIDHLPVHFILGTVLDATQVRDAMIGVDSVIHLAALGSVPRSILNPTLTHATNSTGTLVVLEEARKTSDTHVIVASSSSVYGANPALPKHEREWVRPMSPYAVSKLAAEQYALAYQQSYGLKSLAFRFFNVYGPNQRAGQAYAAVIPVFVDAIINNSTLTINGDGSHSRDFTYVGTVCDIILKAAVGRIEHSEPVNLAFGTETTLNDLVDKISRIVGIPAHVQYGPPRPGDVQKSKAFNASLRKMFPLASPVALDYGLLETVTWFKSLRDETA